jgi:hypothetical protein
MVEGSAPGGDGGAPEHGDLMEDEADPLPVVEGCWQPIFKLVPDDQGVERVRAFARRWRALESYRTRPWLSLHELCSSFCLGLKSRCLALMEAEGFLQALSRPKP